MNLTKSRCELFSILLITINNQLAIHSRTNLICYPCRGLIRILVFPYTNDAPTDTLQTSVRVEIALAFDWLKKGRRRWRNFEVRVAYRPDPDSDSGELKRDGTIQLVGHGLGGRGQFALRGVFSSLFSAERRWRIIPEKLSSDPRLAELSVTQFDIEGGWIGLALTARDVRDEERTARKGLGSVNR